MLDNCEFENDIHKDIKYNNNDNNIRFHILPNYVTLYKTFQHISLQHHFRPGFVRIFTISYQIEQSMGISIHFYSFLQLLLSRIFLLIIK